MSVWLTWVFKLSICWRKSITSWFPADKACPKEKWPEGYVHFYPLFQNASQTKEENHFFSETGEKFMFFIQKYYSSRLLYKSNFNFNNFNKCNCILRTSLSWQLNCATTSPWLVFPRGNNRMTEQITINITHNVFTDFDNDQKSMKNVLLNRQFPCVFLACKCYTLGGKKEGRM